jgi:hypothetical protein
MKKLVLFFLLLFSLVISCKKENNCEGCKENNRPPVADAGLDREITLPMDSVILDGRGSYDPDGGIIRIWKWTKISGPNSIVINNPDLRETKLTALAEGVYQLELKVTDAGGLFNTDTVQIEVKVLPPNLKLVTFYLPDPTGTLPFNNLSFSNPTPTLVTVNINNTSGILSGFLNFDTTPQCPISLNYWLDSEDYLDFHLPPGTYTWEAKSSIVNLSPYPGVSPALVSYFLSPHSTSGTITVPPGNNCIIQKIVF